MRNLWELTEQELRKVYQADSEARIATRIWADRDTEYEITFVLKDLANDAYEIDYAIGDNDRISVDSFLIYDEDAVNEWKKRQNIETDVLDYLNEMFMPDEVLEDCFVEYTEDIFVYSHNIFVADNYTLWRPFHAD